MKQLQFGIVGGGIGSFIGEVHRRGAQLDDMAVLRAGCFSRDAEKNMRTADAWHLDTSRVYADYQEMARAESAREDGIDFVVIATPNKTHYEIAQCFLAHGIHVSCDKPVAMTLTQAEDLARLAYEQGLHFGVSYTYVNYPMVHQMREMIAAGEIGNLLTVMAEYPQDWVINGLNRGDDVQHAWRFNPSQAGNSAATADIGTHLSCLIEFATGCRIDAVLANLSRLPANMPLETNAQVLFRLRDGTSGMLWASQVAIGHECGVSLRVFGDKGALEWNHTRPQRLKYTPANAPERYLTDGRDFLHKRVSAMTRIASGHPEGYYEAFGNYYVGFCSAVLQRQGVHAIEVAPHPTIVEGIEGMRFVDACLRSHERGNTWVELR